MNTRVGGIPPGGRTPVGVSASGAPRGRKDDKGVAAGWGYPFLFGVPAVCDGIAMGHRGMHYSLPLREIVADLVESVAEAHALDGLVLLNNCDKITPGMLMAAARLDIPFT